MAGSRAETVQSLRDYVKIVMLQFEEMYQNLPPDNLAEQAGQLKRRLIDRYVKIQKHNLAVAMQQSASDSEMQKLIDKVDKLNALLR